MTARRQLAYQRESGHSAQCPCYLPCHDLLQAVNARMRQAISASRLHVWAGATWPWRRVSWSRHVLRRRQSGSSSGGREQGRVRRLGICTKRQRRDAGGNNQNDQSEADHGIPSKEPVSEQPASLRNSCGRLNFDILASRLPMPVGGGDVRIWRGKRVPVNKERSASTEALRMIVGVRSHRPKAPDWPHRPLDGSCRIIGD
jgi:hypothetical protein